MDCVSTETCPPEKLVAKHVELIRVGTAVLANVNDDEFAQITSRVEPVMALAKRSTTTSENECASSAASRLSDAIVLTASYARFCVKVKTDGEAAQLHGGEHRDEYCDAAVVPEGMPVRRAGRAPTVPKACRAPRKQERRDEWLTVGHLSRADDGR